MKLRFALVALALAAPAQAHDLFLKPDAFLLAPRSNVRVKMFNGTFTSSENAVTRDRVRDFTLVTPESVRHPENISWKDTGKASEFAIGVGPAGTYVLGLSIKPRELRMEGKAFNDYLREEGVLDVLETRQRAGALERPSRERYSKHVKALLQVGDSRSDVSKPLGYPAEIVPLGNPYALGLGAELELLCLVDGQPAGGVNLIAGSQPRNGKLEAKTYHADALGRVRVPILGAGQHFAKFIRMVPTDETDLDYESKWATLTFEVR